MKIVFISNFMNHHQLPFSKALIDMGIEYIFIATESIPQERVNMGYEDMNHEFGFVICAYENHENYKKAIEACFSADVVIIGSAPDVYIKERLKKNKLTFRYSERIYKNKPPIYQILLRAIKYYWQWGRFKNVYMLCASAYTAADYAKTRTFLNKTYKWGYFPEVKKYDDIDDLIQKKATNSLLWVGRFIDWKCPEKAIEVARRLKQDGYEFTFNIIGTGYLNEELEKLVKDYELQNHVSLLGSMSPEKVREYMEQSEIFLFTSDRQEGWGAVLNESMNSACAVVASHAIGSVPFLVKDGENGFIYKDSDTDDLYNKVKFLLDNPEKRKVMGAKAYETLITQWNAENAAKRFIELANVIISGNKRPDIFADGVCSKAHLLKDNWYK